MTKLLRPETGLQNVVQLGTLWQKIIVFHVLTEFQNMCFIIIIVFIPLVSFRKRYLCKYV